MGLQRVWWVKSRFLFYSFASSDKKGVIYWQKVKSAKKKEKNAIVCWEVEDSVKGLGTLGNIFNQRKQNYVTFWMTAKNEDSVQGLG